MKNKEYDLREKDNIFFFFLYLALSIFFLMISNSTEKGMKMNEINQDIFKISGLILLLISGRFIRLSAKDKKDSP